MLRRFPENDRLLQIFLSIYLEKFKHLFQLFKSVSPVLLLYGLVMVTNKGSIADKCFVKENVGEYLL